MRYFSSSRPLLTLLCSRGSSPPPFLCAYQSLRGPSGFRGNSGSFTRLCLAVGMLWSNPPSRDLQGVGSADSLQLLAPSGSASAAGSGFTEGNTIPDVYGQYLVSARGGVERPSPSSRETSTLLGTILPELPAGLVGAWWGLHQPPTRPCGHCCLCPPPFTGVDSQ